MATIYEVARRAKVSPATVSRVLNGSDNVNAELADRVRKAVQELDYRPNAVARNLRTNRTSLWAVIISDVNNPFFTSVVRGVEDVSQTNGYLVVLCNSDENPDKESQYVSAALAEQMAGVIIATAGRSTHITRLLDANIPVVAIDRQPPGVTVDTVLVDNEHGAEVATRHLLDNGYSRIACITGPKEVSTATERLQGYRRALRKLRKASPAELVRHADFREEGGYAAMAALLDLGKPPDAVFVANNLMTIGALECLTDRGVDIPIQMGVVGFDDIPRVHLVPQSLTTVVQPTYDIGHSAANLLLERIGDPGRAPSTVTLTTHLQVRDSSTPRSPG